MNLVTYSPLIQMWYRWGHFIALAVAAAAAFWVFYDSARRGVELTLWKAFTAIGLILVLPSLAFWGLPALSVGDLSAAVVPFAYGGLGGAALALISLLFYVAGVKVGPGVTYCPVCRQPQHPSWSYCPYCAQQQAQQEATATPFPPPQPPPLASTAQGTPQPLEVPLPRVTKTEVLRPVHPKELAWLVLLSGTHTGREFRLGEATTIGRDPARNDVVMDDNAVSRQHAKIKLEEGQFVLYDLASTDGTFIKDRETEEWVEVHKHTLTDGDQIKIAREVLSFIRVTEEQT